MTKAVKLARAVGTGGVLEDGEIQAAQVTGLATVASTNSYTDLINKPTIPSITGLASETYVSTQINNLINGAPGTLNTLKEIADQLAVDQSAVSALTTLVNSKAATASLATVATTGSYSDLINKPAGGTTYLRKIANYTAADRDGIIADTTAGVFTIFLPATPTTGSQVSIVDGGNWGVNPLTVGRNGSTIEGLTENLTLDIAGVSVQLIYNGTTWEVFAQAGVLSANTVPASSVAGLATVATTGSYTDLINKPTLATVATTGSYTDLTNKPVVATLKVSSIAYPGDDLAADTAGGQTITLTGTGFTAGLSVLVDTTIASVVTVVSSTQVTFTAPAKAAGTYVLYLVATDGSVALSLPGISYSGTPAWSTSAGTLGTQYETTAISKSLSATGDGTVTYSLVSGTLPTGSTLNTSTGAISGTAPVTNSSTTYNFTIRATDSQNQDTDRAFSITLTPDSVTWSNPATDFTVTALPGQAYTQALAATSVASNSISYSADQVPTGLTLSGSTLSGTFTTSQTLTSIITATAANSNRTATRTVNFIITLPSEIYFKSTSLLINGDGTNNSQNNTFVDSSTNSLTITRNGNVSQGTFSPYGPNWSNYFDGSTTSFINTSQSAVFTFDANFTVEFWVYISTNQNSDIVGTANNVAYIGSGNSGWVIAYYTSGGIRFGHQSSNSWVVDTTLGMTPTLNTWNHIAIVRSGSTITGYLNGVAGSTPITSSATFTSNLYGVYVGAGAGNNTAKLGGNVSNLRIVKGTAVYTSNFTPSTTPLTAITNTVLLTCQSNRFIDNSTNNFTVTVSGTPRVERFNPFPSPTGYSTSVIGGSGYFDGTGDYLLTTTTAFQHTADFTYECWVYWNGTITTDWPIIFDTRPTNVAHSNSIALNIHPSTYRLNFYLDGTNYYWGATALPANTWVHVACVRSAGVVKIYQNGVVGIDTKANSNTFSTAAALRIGRNVLDMGHWPGYISNFRVTNTAVYTANFTPPTAPVTAITNTVFLCDFTNASILDYTMSNSLETVGDVKISTATKKYGTGSLYFDGAGDYIVASNTTTGNFGTGDFTIEYWFNSSGIGTAYAPQIGTLDSTSPSYSWRFGTKMGGQNGLWWAHHNGTTYTDTSFSTTNYNDGAWHYAAVVRVNGVLKAFIDGVRVGADQANTVNYTARRVLLGAELVTPSYYTGYMDDVRITKGVARYAACVANTTASSIRDGSTLPLFFSTDNYSVFASAAAGQFLLVDFGQSVNNVTTTYRYGAGSQWAPTSVLIQSSTDRVNWTTRTTYSDTGDGSLQTITSSGSGRYWRMYQNSATRNGSSGYEWHLGSFTMTPTTFTPPTEALTLQ